MPNKKLNVAMSSEGKQFNFGFKVSNEVDLDNAKRAQGVQRGRLFTRIDYVQQGLGSKNLQAFIDDHFVDCIRTIDKREANVIAAIWNTE